MRKHLLPLLAALLSAAATAGVAAADHHRGHSHHRAAYVIGLWGDLPYSDLQKTTGVPNLIADMNRQPLAFTVHDGDIKSGSSPCTDDLYSSFATSLNTLRAPAMFTPGAGRWAG